MVAETRVVYRRPVVVNATFMPVRTHRVKESFTNSAQPNGTEVCT